MVWFTVMPVTGLPDTITDDSNCHGYNKKARHVKTKFRMFRMLRKVFEAVFWQSHIAFDTT